MEPRGVCMDRCLLDTTGRGSWVTVSAEVPAGHRGRGRQRPGWNGRHFSLFGRPGGRLCISWRSDPRIAWRVSRRSVTEDVLRQRLSINVRSLRHAAGLTLKKASERAEMHWRHWQKIEAGEVNVTLQTLVRLGDSLDVDPSDLLREPPKVTKAS